MHSTLLQKSGHGLADGAGIARSRAQHAPTEERAWAGGWGGNCQVACTARSYRRAGMGWRMGRELPGRVHSTLLQKSGHGLADGAGIARSRAQHAPTEDIGLFVQKLYAPVNKPAIKS